MKFPLASNVVASVFGIELDPRGARPIEPPRRRKATKPMPGKRRKPSKGRPRGA